MELLFTMMSGNHARAVDGCYFTCMGVLIIQALHCCMTWILDLAIPSPQSSPSAAAAVGSNSSRS